MKKSLLCIVLTALLVASLLFSAAGCTQEKKLSARSEEEQLEFLAEQGIEVPDIYADYIILFIARIEENPKDYSVLTINNPVLIDLCERVKKVVCEYYGYEYLSIDDLIDDLIDGD